MPGVTPTYQWNQSITYQAAEAIAGGLLVEARTGGGTGGTPGLVGIAAAGSTKVLGVASRDAKPFNAAAPYGTNQDGFPVVDISGVGQYVAVWNHCGIGVTYAAAANFGDLLKAAAGGKVTPLVIGTDNAALVIGKCIEPAGVAANAVGLTTIDC